MLSIAPRSSLPAWLISSKDTYRVQTAPDIDISFLGPNFMANNLKAAILWNWFLIVVDKANDD